MKKLLAKELGRIAPETTSSTIFGRYSMRFELGGAENTDSRIRIEQATARAMAIYTHALHGESVILLIEEWDSSWLKSGKDNHQLNLINVLDHQRLKRFEGPFDQTYYEQDQAGNKIERLEKDGLKCDLSLGRVQLPLESASKIIRGIIATEMGGVPYITQRIYFYSPEKQTGMLVYDDRGCDVWADDLDILRPTYEKFNDWILAYNRVEVEEMFGQ
ncbi:DUF3885 domain-containing protein [Lewinella sp. 4G2]|uniref:DUF3885 domain-containing protein n=1 Tax=Lewinella sp. 4G2 TaxID=1803372 RepID=UPI0007B480B2|nr:DUF3885 domain-containing protein [Lewinella sp. 4G2]OAV43182.1 hypothetical protein A3850_001130 [Lewinella sp. 4G2]